MAYIGNTVENQGFTPAIDYFNGDGVTVTFTLSRPIASVAQVIVAIDNVIQNPSSSYTVAGSAITFSSAPLSGTNNIWVEYTSLITTYQAISQDPTVIGDIRATGGYLAEGDFGNSFVDGAILDYVTGNGRVTVGSLDDITFYHGGTAGRSEIMKLSYAGNSTLTGNLAISGSATIQGLTVGKGGGAVSTNTAIGASALSTNSAGTRNTAVGSTAGSGITGSRNTVLGDNILAGSTSGNDNVGIGDFTMRAYTGSGSTAVGAQAMANGSANTGDNNTAIGSGSLNANASGASNTAVGGSALTSNTTASQNTAVGYTALTANTTGTQSCALGVGAGAANTTGSGNIFIGIDSGNATIGHTTGSYNTFIGRCNGSSVSATNQLVITASNSVIAGKGDSTGFISPSGGGVYQGNNSSSWSTTSDRRLKKNIVDNTIGLSAINSIQVRNFEYRLPEEITELEPQNAIEIAGVQIGAIAQEIQAILPECVKTESTGVMSVDTTNLTWYLINAVKELNAKVEAQALEIATLKAAK